MIFVFIFLVIIGAGVFFYLKKRKEKKKKQEEKAIIESIDAKRKAISEKLKALKPPTGATPSQLADMFFEIVDENKDDEIDETELSLIPEEMRKMITDMDKEAKLNIFEDKKMSKQEYIDVMSKTSTP